MIIFNSYIKLVGGWALPLWKIWLRQLGWWNSQYMEKQASHVPVTTNQMIYTYINPNKSPFSYGFPMVYRRLALPRSAAPLIATPLQRHHQDARITVAGAIADGHRVPVHLGRTTNPNGSQWISWGENLKAETCPIFPWRSWDFPVFCSLNQSIEDRAKVKTFFMTSQIPWKFMGNPMNSGDQT